MSDEAREDIMAATYAALAEHGFAELTTQDIADESSVSKAALHYHYDSKRDLLLAFLDHLYDDYVERFEDLDGDDPRSRLIALIDELLTLPESNERSDFQTAVLEMKAQAPYDEAFRERIVAFDEFVGDRVSTIVAEGIDRGQFRDDADPDEVAEFFATVVNGAHTRYVVEGDGIGSARRRLIEYVDHTLVADAREVER